MATMLTGNLTTTTTVDDGEQVFLAPGATVNTSGRSFAFAVDVTGELTVAGMAVTSNSDAIRANGDDTITVTSTGSVHATGGDGDAIEMTGSGNKVIVSGFVYGFDNGIIDFNSDGNETIITATGVVRGGSNGGSLSGDAATFQSRGTNHTLRNDGTLIADENEGSGRFIAVANAGGGAGEAGFEDGFSAVLNFYNSGLVIGDVLLQAGNDLFDGQGGMVQGVVNGGQGRDILRGGEFEDELLGGDNADTLRGRQGDDTLAGGSAGDLIYGGKGEDTLAGNNGKDEIRGGKGDDTIIGGAGKDFLRGGQDADSFVFSNVNHSSKGKGADRIFDFGRGNDVIDLSGLGPDVVVETVSRAYGTLVRIDADDNGSIDSHIRVIGVSGMNDSDFLFDA